MKSTTNFRALTQSAVAMIVATFAFVACQDYDNGFDEATIRYNQNFKNIFGQIDPNQDWNLVRQLAEKNEDMSTRRLLSSEEFKDGGSMDGTVATRRNQWYLKEYCLDIPGYPNEEGIYISGDQGGIKKYFTIDEVEKLEGNDPIGDVTDEEILYVSEWFRSNHKPQSIKVHWKNFFVQHISFDCDRISGVDDEGNPTCKDGARKNGALAYTMEQLCAKTLSGTWVHINNFNSGSVDFRTENYAQQAPGYEHPEATPGYNADDVKKRNIQLFVGAGTEDFAYHSTLTTQESGRFNDYVLVHLQFSIEQPSGKKCEIHRKQCAVHEYDGYYLGFDYESRGAANEPEKHVEADGFYSNWILKLSYTSWVGDPDATKDYDPEVIESGLLVCEDLGDYDYDFNDVVLKLEHRQVKKENSSGDASTNGNESTEVEDKLVITAMAAGGALPSYIYFVDNLDDRTNPQAVKGGISGSNEIHALLNGSAPQIINAGVKFGKEGEKWEYTLKEGDWNSDQYKGFVSQVFDEERIEIHVAKEDGVTVIKTKNNIDGTYESDAPQMMLLPTYFEWPQETQRIDWGYQYFADWVKDATQTHWIYYQTDKEVNITERDVSRPLPVTGMIYPGLYAMFYGTIIYDGQTINLPPDETDVVYVDLCSNSNGNFSIRVEGNENDLETVDVELVDGNQLMINNKLKSGGQVTVKIYQEAYGNYTSASMEIKISDLGDGRLRWRNGTMDGMKAIDIIAEETVTQPYAAATNNSNPVNMTVNANHCFEAEMDEENSAVNITGKSMGQGTITLTQGTSTAPLTVTVYERCEDNAELKEKGYFPAAVRYTNNTCQVLATTFYYDHPLGALLIVDKKVTITDNDNNVIPFKSQDGDYYVYELSVEELKKLSKTPSHQTSTSPLTLSGTGANGCKVYVRSMNLNDLYGDTVEYEESKVSIKYNDWYSEDYYSYTISSDKIPVSGGIITFIPQLSGSDYVEYTFEFNNESGGSNWKSCKNGGEIEKPVQGQQDVILWTKTQISNLKVFIKEATTSAKKRTTHK